MVTLSIINALFSCCPKITGILLILLFVAVRLLVFIDAFMGEDFVSSTLVFLRYLLRSFPVRGSFADQFGDHLW